MTHPFQTGTWRDSDGNPQPIFYCSVQDRMDAIKRMDEQQLEAVIALDDCQKTVRKAAESRIKKLRSSAHV